MALVRPGRPAALAALATFALAGILEPVEAPRPTEYEVKAAFLYNFAKFVKWPEEKAIGPTFVIAVLGDDPFGGLLDKMLAGKMVLGRRVEVRRISTPGAAHRTQILFVGSSEGPRLAEILKTLEGASVLTVGEMDGFTDRGGMIAFKLRDDLVRFDINLDRVERAGLKMSSQLIRLAQRVISRSGGV